MFVFERDDLITNEHCFIVISVSGFYQKSIYSTRKQHIHADHASPHEFFLTSNNGWVQFTLWVVTLKHTYHNSE